MEKYAQLVKYGNRMTNRFKHIYVHSSSAWHAYGFLCHKLHTFVVKYSFLLNDKASWIWFEERGK